MAYTNLPLNLQDMFYSLNDRVAKLETGPNAPQVTADSAFSLATSATSTAVAAQTTATGALTTANGKNTVYYSTTTPGSTANTAGDIWYQYGTSGSYLNKVIAQWSGAGGTTWNTVKISGLVVANIDAGSITTGTLNATLVTITTTTTGANSITFSGANNSIDFVAGGSPVAHILPLGAGGSAYGLIMHYGASADPGGNTFPQINVLSGQIFLGYSVSRNLTVSSTGILITGDIYANNYIYYSGYPSSSSSPNVYMNVSTGLLAKASSSTRYKLNIEPQDIPKESILALTPKSYVDKYQADEQGSTDGLQRLLGLIAEDLAEIPFLKDSLVEYNNKGIPESVYYDRLAVALIPLLKEHEARLNQLEGK